MKKSKHIIFIVNMIVLLSIVLFSNQSIGLASSHSHHAQAAEKEWERLNKLAEESLFLFKKKEYEASRKRINDLSAYFLQVEIAHYVDRIEQAEILLESIVQAKEALTNVKLDEVLAGNKLMQMNLAIDAVSHKKHPLWIQYYPKVAGSVNDLVYALDGDNRDAFYHSINNLSTHYELVRPAMYVSHEVGVVEKLDSQLDFIINNKNDLWKNKDKAYEMLKLLEKEIKIAFHQETKESSQSLMIILTGIGSLICSVLSYVAWRKYKAEGDRKTIVWKKIT
jgi:sporulation protein YpjB